MSTFRRSTERLSNLGKSSPPHSRGSLTLFEFTPGHPSNGIDYGLLGKRFDLTQKQVQGRLKTRGDISCIALRLAASAFCRIRSRHAAASSFGKTFLRIM